MIMVVKLRSTDFDTWRDCNAVHVTNSFLPENIMSMKRGAENYITKDDGPHDDVEVLLFLTRTKAVSY
jgi:hypothetical protein